MLIQLIRCEKMKCKGTLIWPAFFLIPVIPVLLGCGNYLSNLGILKSQWYSLWTQISLFYSNFFLPLSSGSTARFCGAMKTFIPAGICFLPALYPTAPFTFPSIV